MIIKYFTQETVLKNTDGDVVEYDYNKILNAFKIDDKLEKSFISTGGGLTASELLYFWGGGATTTTNDGGIISALDTTSNKYNEAIGLHEFFGHGRPLSIESSTAIYDEGDAVRFENLVWRLLGIPGNQRDGHDHGDQKKEPMINPYILPTFR